MMIVSASRRTDIPAFYHQWFMNRIRAGFCLVPNPFNPTQVARVSLTPEDVAVIVFWTRNPTPLLPYLDELDRRGYRYYFQFTLTGYPRLLEPGLPAPEALVEAFRRLAERVGAEKVIWRYDPLLFSNITDVAFHRQNFVRLADALAGYTRRVVLSLFDPYTSVMRRLRKVPQLELSEASAIEEELPDLLRFLAQMAASHGLEARSCAEARDWTPYGILPGKCVDDELIARLFGVEVTHTKDAGQRPTCRCVQSKDIGVYHTCRHGCLYCYATGEQPYLQTPTRHHDPLAPSLA